MHGICQSYARGGDESIVQQLYNDLTRGWVRDLVRAHLHTLDNLDAVVTGDRLTLVAVFRSTAN